MINKHVRLAIFHNLEVDKPGRRKTYLNLYFTEPLRRNIEPHCGIIEPVRRNISSPFGLCENIIVFLIVRILNLSRRSTSLFRVMKTLHYKEKVLVKLLYVIF